MTVAILKQGLGDAGAHIDKSHGTDTLYDCIKALSTSAPHYMVGRQVNPAASTIDSFIALAATKLHTFAVALADTGSSGATLVDVEVNSSVVASISVDNAIPDQEVVSAQYNPPINIPAGSFVEIVVNTAASGSSTVTAAAFLSPVTIE